MRAANGHPAPYDVNFVEIGNEDFFSSTYPTRYPLFYNAIHAAFPIGPLRHPLRQFVQIRRIDLKVGCHSAYFVVSQVNAIRLHFQSFVERLQRFCDGILNVGI